MGKKSQAEASRSQESAEQGELESKLSELTPEQAEMFARALELAMKKRRVMLIGHLAAILAIVIGFVGALYLHATSERGTFIGWVYLSPLAVAGVLLWLFGKLAKRIDK